MLVNKYLKFIGAIITTLVIIVGIASLYSIWQSSKAPNQLPSVFGYMSMTVLTGSMEPRLEAGDLIIVKTANLEKAKVNDVITFKNSNNTLITHRIVDVITENGSISFQTKGDANNIVDQELVLKEQVIGSLQFHIPKAGHLMNFLKSPLGLSMLVIFLCLIATIGNLKNLTTKFREHKDGK